MMPLGPIDAPRRARRSPRRATSGVREAARPGEKTRPAIEVGIDREAVLPLGPRCVAPARAPVKLGAP